jgi:hypothetical protein
MHARTQPFLLPDEANHREVNHTFADISLDAVNPYVLKQQEQVRANKRSILETKQENKEFVQQVLRQWDASRTGSLQVGPSVLALLHRCRR